MMMPLYNIFFMLLPFWTADFQSFFFFFSFFSNEIIEKEEKRKFIIKEAAKQRFDSRRWIFFSFL